MHFLRDPKPKRNTCTVKGFNTEVKLLLGRDALPMGEIFLTCYSNGAAVVYAATHLLSPPDCCEMKRIYTSLTERGLDIEKLLYV